MAATSRLDKRSIDTLIEAVSDIRSHLSYTQNLLRMGNFGSWTFIHNVE